MRLTNHPVYFDNILRQLALLQSFFKRPKFPSQHEYFLICKFLQLHDLKWFNDHKEIILEPINTNNALLVKTRLEFIQKFIYDHQKTINITSSLDKELPHDFDQPKCFILTKYAHQNWYLYHENFDDLRSLLHNTKPLLLEPNEFLSLDEYHQSLYTKVLVVKQWKGFVEIMQQTLFKMANKDLKIALTNHWSIHNFYDPILDLFIKFNDDYANHQLDLSSHNIFHLDHPLPFTNVDDLLIKYQFSIQEVLTKYLNHPFFNYCVKLFFDQFSNNLPTFYYLKKDYFIQNYQLLDDFNNYILDLNYNLTKHFFHYLINTNFNKS